MELKVRESGSEISEIDECDKISYGDLVAVKAEWINGIYMHSSPHLSTELTNIFLPRATALVIDVAGRWIKIFDNSSEKQGWIISETLSKIN